MCTMTDLSSFEEKFAPADMSQELADTIKKKPSLWQKMQKEMQKMFAPASDAKGHILKKHMEFQESLAEKRKHQ